MIKNILITGGAGFIGSNLALKLLSKGYKVRVLDNLSKQIHGDDYNNSYLYNSIKNKVEFIHGDIRDRACLLKAIKDQDAIFHFAAETGTGQSMYEIERYVDVNIKGTALLLDILSNEKHRVKKLIYSSSRAIYGEGRYFCEDHGFIYPKERNKDDMKNGFFDFKCNHCNAKLKLMATDEESKIIPSSIYAMTKQSGEDMLNLISKAKNIDAISLRFQNVYGPGQSLKNPYTGILSIFSNLIRNKKDINIFEDGLESRDFVYIDDVVDANILALESSIKNEIYNVGSGVSTTVLDVAKELIKNYNIDVNVNVSGHFRMGDIRHNYASLDKIKKDLGFTPKYSFKDGIKLFTSWVMTQDIEKDLYEKSINEMKEKGLYS